MTKRAQLVAELAALDALEQVAPGPGLDHGADRDHRVNACAVRLGRGSWCGLDRDHAGDHRDVTAGPTE